MTVENQRLWADSILESEVEEKDLPREERRGPDHRVFLVPCSELSEYESLTEAALPMIRAVRALVERWH